jgi:membrane protease YdiL (CAAX protease family)
MDATVSAKRDFPYANWGPLVAALGMVLALATGAVLAVGALLVDHPKSGADPSDVAAAVAQLLAELSFFFVPIAIAAWRGATFDQALRRLGFRRFRPSAAGWMLAAIGAYLAFSIAYIAIFGVPHQDDVAEDFGSVPVQVLLIAVAAPICEETCFRGFLFGGLRERLPRWAAALISALVFGGLHATTGLGAIPILVAFGFILALLYEKTGSIIPGILLHMLNNSVALLGH